MSKKEIEEQKRAMEEYERANTQYKKSKDDFPSLDGSTQLEQSKEKYEDQISDVLLSQNQNQKVSKKGRKGKMVN